MMPICRSEIAAREIRVGDVIVAGKGRRLTVTEVERILDSTPCEGSEPFATSGWWVTGIGITACETAVNGAGKTVTRELYRERGLADTVMVER